MKLFDCNNCGQPLYFDNTTCEKCGLQVGFLPAILSMTALKPAGEGLKALAAPRSGKWQYCKNHELGACNWLVPVNSAEEYCTACRLNRTIPDLSIDHHDVLWRKLEAGKRRMVYSLLSLGLPVRNKHDDPEKGIAFDFLAGEGGVHGSGGHGVITGHDHGLITLNLAEADDAMREKNRQNLHEPYRTVLGHFRHEIGHYYEELLVEDTPWQERARALFGDETQDYSAALDRHYNEGPPAGWEQTYISSYATAHPWEDFAETWAHYMHITDTLELAGAYGLKTDPRVGRRKVRQLARDYSRTPRSFDEIISAFVPLSVTLNTLNKAMGQRDLYPFVLSTAITDKLRFVHDLIEDAAGR